MCFFVAILVLMGLGGQYHDNYEYYGQYPLLYVTPGLVGLVVGFFLPSLPLRTFLTASVSGVVCFFAGILTLSFSRLGGSDSQPALSIVPVISGVIGLFLPSLWMWGFRKVTNRTKGRD